MPTTVSSSAKRRQKEIGQGHAADRRLQVEADHRHFFPDPPAMGDHFVFGCAPECGEAEQDRVIAQAGRDLRLGDGLPGAAGDPGDEEERSIGPIGRRFAGEAQHRLVQPGLADRELGGVHADRQPARAGVDIVAAQRPLPGLVQRPGRGQRQGVGRDHRAGAEARQRRLRDIRNAPRHRPYTAVRWRSMQVASTSSGSRRHQLSFEKISTSEAPS